ncbi:MAG: FCD domain-containing protein [Haliea sp.]
MVSYVEVKEQLIGRITDQTWVAGSKIPSERSLADEIGASRNTIRKAIKALAVDSYLQIRENSRPIVAFEQESGFAERPGRRDNTIKPNSQPSEQYILDSSPLEVLESRLVIEPEVAALATLRARKENIDEIKAALDQSLSAKTLADFEYWDGHLHMAIFRATRNTALIGHYHALNQIRNQTSWIELKRKSVTEERRQLYNQQHVAIVDAIVQRLPNDAKLAMKAHLESVRNAMMP